MKQESDTKRKLLETAIGLIWESSYGAVSVDDICTKAGVNKGSFYYAFKSKSELAVAAYERFWESKRAIMDRIHSPQVPPLERLRKACDFTIQDQTDKMKSFGKVLGCPFVSLGCELSTQDEAIRQKVEVMSGRIIKYHEALIRDLVAEGQVETKDVHGLAQELYFYFTGVLMQAKIENNLKVLDRLHCGATRLLGIKQSAACA